MVSTPHGTSSTDMAKEISKVIEIVSTPHGTSSTLTDENIDKIVGNVSTPHGTSSTIYNEDTDELVAIMFPHHMVLLLPRLTDIVIHWVYLNIFRAILRQVSNKPMSI